MHYSDDSKRASARTLPGNRGLLSSTPSCPEGVLTEELKWKRGGSPRGQAFTAHSGLAQSLGRVREGTCVKSQDWERTWDDARASERN